jgi:hypothetical protein
MEEKRPLELNLPPLEDANAVMLWLMDTLRGLAEGQISEKTAGLMFYGLQLAMVNARFTTFRDTNHAEMVRKAPRQGKTKPQRTPRNTKEEGTGDFTAKGAEVAKKEGLRGLAIATPRSEEKALPQRTQRNTEEEGTGDFTAKGAEVAKKEDRGELATATPRSEGRALPQRTQRNTEEEATPTFTAKGAEVAEKEGQLEPATATPRSEEKALPERTQRNTEEEQNPVDPLDSSAESPTSAGEDFTAENAEVAEEKGQEKDKALQVESNLEPQNAEVIPGVESAKSLFFGVEAGEGVADNRPVSPPSEPPRKSSQSEILMIPTQGGEREATR